MFQRVFGTDTYSVHFSAEDEFIDAQMLNNAQLQNRHLLCTDYVSAESVRDYIGRKYGETMVHTAHGRGIYFYILITGFPLLLYIIKSLRNSECWIEFCLLRNSFRGYTK